MDYKNELNSDDDFDCSNSYSDNFGSGNCNNRDSSSGYISNGQNRMANPNGLSKAELRKTNKPIMEKRRRARINHCLNELKTLILEAMKKDPARHTKLEKADILEMTVKHLQSLQRQQLNMAIQTDPSVVHKFKTGFVECAEEVNRYISQLEGIDTATRQRLNNHLNSCATSLEQIGSMTNFSNGYRHASILATNSMAPATATATSASVGLLQHLPQDMNNNNRLAAASAVTVAGNGGGNTQFPTAASIQMNGVQLIPSRLPSGELALIVPNHPHAANAAVNGVGSFPSWPTAAAAAAAAAAAVAASTGTVPPMPLIDNVATLPTLNNFASQLQRMSAFTKPSAHILPMTKFNSHNTNTSTISNTHTINSNSNSNLKNNAKISAPEAVSVPSKSHFHTTTAAVFHQTVPHNSTTTTSPPLSPISSVSSLSAAGGEDSSSLMHTSSDLAASRPTTPPHDTTVNVIMKTATGTATATTTMASSASSNSFSGVFATPPLSAESSLSLSTSSGVSSLSLSLSLSSRGSRHLQQQQVSSTSGIESSNTKRSLLETTEEADSSDSSLHDEPPSKRLASEIDIEEDSPEDEVKLIAKETSNDCKRQKLQISPEDRDCMWRPW